MLQDLVRHRNYVFHRAELEQLLRAGYRFEGDLFVGPVTTSRDLQMAGRPADVHPGPLSMRHVYHPHDFSASLEERQARACLELYSCHCSECSMTDLRKPLVNCYVVRDDIEPHEYDEIRQALQQANAEAGERWSAQRENHVWYQTVNNINGTLRLSMWSYYVPQGSPDPSRAYRYATAHPPYRQGPTIDLDANPEMAYELPGSTPEEQIASLQTLVTRTIAMGRAATMGMPTETEEDLAAYLDRYLDAALVNVPPRLQPVCEAIVRTFVSGSLSRRGRASSPNQPPEPPDQE